MCSLYAEVQATHTRDLQQHTVGKTVEGNWSPEQHVVFIDRSRRERSVDMGLADTEEHAQHAQEGTETAAPLTTTPVE